LANREARETDMTQSEKLQNAANLHNAIATMNSLRGDPEQAKRDFGNCDQYATWASQARIKEGRGI
jgi:hypothetical protein